MLKSKSSRKHGDSGGPIAHSLRYLEERLLRLKELRGNIKKVTPKNLAPAQTHEFLLDIVKCLVGD